MLKQTIPNSSGLFGTSLSMETRANTTGYKLIEGQEKQGLLDRYINQLSDFDAESSVEIYQISSNLLKSSEISASQRDENMPGNSVKNFISSTFSSKEPAYTNNQENISSLSDLISKRKDTKSDKVSYEARGSRNWSATNITETIRSTL